MMNFHLKKNIVVQVSSILFNIYQKPKKLILEIENETINRELEKQFNEGLQSKILHTHHEGLGFYNNETSTPSISNDWHHQQLKETFVPTTTEKQNDK
jgi:hypothetical protein